MNTKKPKTVFDMSLAMMIIGALIIFIVEIQSYMQDNEFIRASDPNAGPRTYEDQYLNVQHDVNGVIMVR